MRTLGSIFALVMSAMAVVVARPASAEPPVASYIFPAGGQRGTTVAIRVGGLYLNDACNFDLLGEGVSASKRIAATKTLWFEGPLLYPPLSQQPEVYPKDFAGSVRVDSSAVEGVRYWRVSTSQGTTSLKKFVVGDLPEIVEDEIDGDPIPTPIKLPVTINGRIFPREDVDIWTFSARAGDRVSCEVAATRIGSPLDARLDVRRADGRLVAENVNVPGPDAGLRFTAPADGEYQLRICDAAFRGNQDYVYRLTVTKGPALEAVYPFGGRHNSQLDLHLTGANLPTDIVRVKLPAFGTSTVVRPQMDEVTHADIPLEMDDLPEFVEETADRLPNGAHRAALPAVLNGRILHPGEADIWQVTAHKGDSYCLDLRAGRLGSLLDSVLTILDSQGKRLATCDDMSAGQTDSQLAWKVPVDGTYSIRVEDRLASRGGPQYAYRLKIDRANRAADFQLKLAVNALNIERGAVATLPIAIERRGGFKGPVTLELGGLPAGVTASRVAQVTGATAEIRLKASRQAQVVTSAIVVRGRAVIDGKTVKHTAFFPTDPSDPPIEQVALAVAVPTPFKFSALYDQAYTPRGSVYVKHYVIARNGYNGPLEVRPADRRARYAQGVNGPTLHVAEQAESFDYPLTLAPFMEILRTSRTNLMATGIVVDPDGMRHPVTYATDSQNEQMVTIVSPERMTLVLDPASVLAEPGKSAVVRVRAVRGQQLTGAVRVELVRPRHIQGVAAAPATIESTESGTDLRLRFADGALGPFNMPLTVRATGNDSRGYPVIAESALSIGR
ncbi:MAG TPA: PPC domain-containing protein [Planctomycetaceae bacterium]|nr:PPC domain-containing protein [Planctomycetaceae bacterium]